MRASKESAEMAKQQLAQLADGLDAELTNSQRAFLRFIGEFLNVAKRKLPTEAAYEKDRKRRRLAK